MFAAIARDACTIAAAAWRSLEIVSSASSCSAVCARADAAAFNRAKTLAVVGLTLGFLLWHVGFMSIGGEWFGMWQSQQWNGVPSAFRFVMTIIAVLIFVAIPDQELERGGTA